MPALAIQKTTIDNLTAARRQVVRWVSSRLALGDQALYIAGSTLWYVWDDHRLDLDHLAVLGAVAAAFTDIPPSYDPNTKTRAQVESDVRGFVGARLKWPSTIDYTNSANPWQTTLDAQGAPAIIRAAGSVPSGLTVVTTA